MSDSNPTTLLLAVPGPEQYAAVPKAVVRNAIKQGQIRQSQLIWSPPHNDWMQVRDLPDLSQETQQLQIIPQHLEPELTPEPPATVTLQEPNPEPPKTQSLVAPMPTERNMATTFRTSAPVPKPKAAVVKVGPTKNTGKPASSRSHEIVEAEEEDGFPIFKVLSLVLFFSILGLLGSNFVLVDTPLRNNLSGTKYAPVQVYAHLVGFYQPDALTLNLFASPVLNQDNLLDFLVTLAQSTPRTALQGNLFSTVAIAPGLSAKYCIRGQDWNQFALMSQASEEQRKSFLLQHLTDMEGNFLLSSLPSMEDTAETNASTKIIQAWEKLSQSLLHPE